jgi:hypothetical protein
LTKDNYRDFYMAKEVMKKGEISDDDELEKIKNELME